MKFAICVFVLLVLATGLASVSGQPVDSSLIRIKERAEKGDSQAQYDLAETYHARADTTNALSLFRKSARQGCVQAESRLGRILISFASSPLATESARFEHVDEGLKLLIRAAHKSDRAAQLALAQELDAAKFVKQDYVEAFKWYSLAATEQSAFNFTAITAKTARDALVLKMTSEQIATGKLLVSSFVPGVGKESEAVKPLWIDEIKLMGISGAKSNRLAIINGVNVAAGNTITIKVQSKSMNVRCLQVDDDSAAIELEDRSLVLRLIPAKQ